MRLVNRAGVFMLIPAFEVRRIYTYLGNDVMPLIRCSSRYYQILPGFPFSQTKSSCLASHDILRPPLFARGALAQWINTRWRRVSVDRIPTFLSSTLCFKVKYYPGRAANMMPLPTWNDGFCNHSCSWNRLGVDGEPQRIEERCSSVETVQA
jgi:hypothetical protein